MLIISSSIIELYRLINCSTFYEFCFVERGQVSEFRAVRVAKLGAQLVYTCRLSFGSPSWYDVNGQMIKNNQDQIIISKGDTEAGIAVSEVTLNNAGVYFCNGTKYYGSLVIYVEGMSFKIKHTKFIKYISILK